LCCVHIIRPTEYLISRPSESEGTFQSFPSGYDLFAPQHGRDLGGGWNGDGGGGQGDGQREDEGGPLPPTRMSAWPPRNRKQDLPSTQEDPRARFFEDYRNEAEEYDREFMKKYDEDLNTTLIFVSSA